MPQPWGSASRGDGGGRLLGWGLHAWAVIGILLLAYVLVWVLGHLRVLLAPLLIAFVVTYLLAPVVGWLEQRRVPRAGGTALAYLAVLGVLALTAVTAGPPLVAQVRDAVAQVPATVETLEARVESALDRVGLDTDIRLDGARAQAWLLDPDNRGMVLSSLSGLRSVTASVAQVGFVLVLGPVLAFYLLVSLPRLVRAGGLVIPPRHRAEGAEVAAAVSGTVGGFLRGQLLVAAFVGAATTLAMALVGLPLWLLVGVVAGVTNLVPFVGPFIGGALAVLVAFAYGEPWTALWAALAILVVQQVESHVVSPLVVGRTVRLHPLLVMLAVLVGGSLAGVLGLLVAVPLMASAKIVLTRLWVRFVPYGDELPAAAGRNPAPASPPG